VGTCADAAPAIVGTTTKEDCDGNGVYSCDENRGAGGLGRTLALSAGLSSHHLIISSSHHLMSSSSHHLIIISSSLHHLVAISLMARPH
jgi:hypothetical protein